MNPASKDILAILVADALVTEAATTGWAGYYGREPDEAADRVPVTTVTVYDTDAWKAPEGNARMDYPGVMVRVRAATYAAGFEKALALRDALLSRPAESQGGVRYSGFFVEGDILAAGRNEHDRPIFTINLRLIREPDTGQYRS